MSHKHKSAGCFPGQTAVNSVSQDDLRRLTYGTTYRHGTPGRMMSEEDKWENFSDVHGIGKKDTKYTRFQKSTAPLLDRTACTGSREYVARPLGDNIINRELAANFKQGSFANKPGLDVTAKADSSYAADFVNYPTHRMRSAKPGSFKPNKGQTQPLSALTEMMETQATSHSSFAPPNQDLAKAAELLLMKPNLGLSGAWGAGPPKSSYGHEFRGMRRSASSPQVMTGAQLGLPDPPQELLPCNHPSFHNRRTIFMSPGQ